MYQDVKLWFFIFYHFFNKIIYQTVPFSEEILMMCFFLTKQTPFWKKWSFKNFMIK